MTHIRDKHDASIVLANIKADTQAILDWLAQLNVAGKIPNQVMSRLIRTIGDTWSAADLALHQIDDLAEAVDDYTSKDRHPSNSKGATILEFKR